MFNISEVTILDSKLKTILKGSRDTASGLWRINLHKKMLQIARAITEQQKQLPAANNVYELRNTGALVNYLHKAIFSCTKSALLNSVKKGHLSTWTGLTEEAINKHLKMTPATAMGHMNQKRQNIRSTRK